MPTSVNSTPIAFDRQGQPGHCRVPTRHDTLEPTDGVSILPGGLANIGDWDSFLPESHPVPDLHQSVGISLDRMRQSSLRGTPFGKLERVDEASRTPTMNYLPEGSRSCQPSPSQGKALKRQGSDAHQIGNPDATPPPSKKRDTIHLKDEEGSFACPYFKKDKIRYLPCLMLRLSRIRDVKQHIYRRHRGTPDYYCPVCYESFPSRQRQDNHVREKACSHRQPPCSDGITAEQRRHLSYPAPRESTLEDQYLKMWAILFPGRDAPASIYIRSIVEEILIMAQEFYETEAPNLIYTSCSMLMLRKPLTLASPGLIISLFKDTMKKLETDFLAKVQNACAMDVGEKDGADMIGIASLRGPGVQGGGDSDGNHLKQDASLQIYRNSFVPTTGASLTHLGQVVEPAPAHSTWHNRPQTSQAFSSRQGNFVNWDGLQPFQNSLLTA
jgi:hypothetical protein